jgi:hypothetical protein
MSLEQLIVLLTHTSSLKMFVIIKKKTHGAIYFKIMNKIFDTYKCQKKMG